MQENTPTEQETTEEKSPSISKRRFRLDRRFLVGFVAGLLIAVAGFGIVAATGPTDDESGEIEDIAPGALNITDQEARDLVQDEYPNAEIVTVDLDGETGDLIYDVDLDSGEEIMVDARTGELLGPEQDDADDEGGDDDK